MYKSIKHLENLTAIYLKKQWITRPIGSHLYFIPKYNFWVVLFTRTMYIIVYCITKPNIYFFVQVSNLLHSKCFLQKSKYIPVFIQNSLLKCQITFSSGHDPYNLRYYYFSDYGYQERLVFESDSKENLSEES